MYFYGLLIRMPSLSPLYLIGFPKFYKKLFATRHYSFKNYFIPNKIMETEIPHISRHHSHISSMFLIKIFPELIEIGNSACEA